MTNFTQDFATLLGQVNRPGDYYATGTVDIHPPRLEVEGIGPISLPLLPTQAQQIVDAADRAPYGRGTETLIDTQVRRTWQIGAEQVRISGKVWDQDLEAMVAQATAGLGVTGPVVAELYKLLVYDAGSFFVRHRDSEKSPGMFATMVVVLPSDYSGGELLVRHKGREVRLDLRRDEPSEAAFAAFYADCVHEVLPIASGYRLALVFNLARGSSDPLPLPPDYASEQSRLASLLRAWTEEQIPALGASTAPSDVPTKLIYPLEHAYTQAELDFSSLKGADAAVAGVVMGAAQDADCDLHLALVSIAESGWAEHTGGGGYRRRYWGDSDEEFEVGEVDERTETVHEWRHPDGSRPALGALPFLVDELSPPDAFEELDPDELDFQEATGNEGATFDRLYQSAALVLWPRTQRIVVLGQGGLESTVPFLGELTRQWKDSGAGRDAPSWREAHRLAEQIRRDWPTDEWGQRQASQEGHGENLLLHLADLGDREEIDSFLTTQSVAGAYGVRDNAALVKALDLLPPMRATGLISAILSRNASVQPVACSNLLARCTVAGLDHRASLHPAADVLLQALPGDAPNPPAVNHGRQSEAPTSVMLADVLSALECIDRVLANQALGHFLTNPATYPVDRLLLSATQSLCASKQTRGLPTVHEMRGAVISHLQQRVAEPLEPPADWRRPSKIGCTCTYCGDLSRFLSDPSQPVWLLKAAQATRTHVEHFIRASHCDLDCVTERRGSPHTLRCTKNQASYQRRVEQRRQDLEHLLELCGGRQDASGPGNGHRQRSNDNP